MTQNDQHETPEWVWSSVPITTDAGRTDPSVGPDRASDPATDLAAFDPANPGPVAAGPAAVDPAASPSDGAPAEAADPRQFDADPAEHLGARRTDHTAADGLFGGGIREDAVPPASYAVEAEAVGRHQSDLGRSVNDGGSAPTGAWTQAQPWSPAEAWTQPESPAGADPVQPTPAWAEPSPAAPPQYAQPPNGQPHYGQPQNGQPHYAQPQNAQPDNGRTQFLAPDQPREQVRPVGPVAPNAGAERGPDLYAAPAPAAVAGPGPTGPPTSPRPEALLLPGRSPIQSNAAAVGWQGRIRRLSGGLVKPQPSTAEMTSRKARQDIQRTFSRPMTVVVIQPKGGAGKTPTTIGLASALGANRGGYVVGWDDNETRGTLAVRVMNSNEQRTTVWDLLRDLPHFERADARVGDLSHYMRSQGAAQFDALVSDDNPGNMAQIGEDEFRRIHQVLQRFYREIIIDTGNNVRSPNWQAAVNAADLIVVVSTYQRDVGYSGSWVLDHLSETGREHLVSSAVTVLSAADPTPDPTVRKQLLEHFTARTGSVIEIPYDPVIAVGGPMEWTQLKPETRQAWVRAGAAVVEALANGDERARQASRLQ